MGRVLVYKLDRFSRNKYETAIHKKTLKDNGVRVVSAMENIPDTPEGIILESLLEGLAEYYSAEYFYGHNISKQKEGEHISSFLHLQHYRKVFATSFPHRHHISKIKSTGKVIRHLKHKRAAAIWLSFF